MVELFVDKIFCFFIETEKKAFKVLFSSFLVEKQHLKVY